MNKTTRPLGVNALDANQLQSPHTQNQRRYANILCCLRDDIELMTQETSTPCQLDDGQVSRLVAKHYEKSLPQLEWEDAIVRILKKMADHNTAPHDPTTSKNANQFAHRALTHMRQITPNSYVWMA